ncbi:hypothetical protein LSTR_LSTR006997 [Laodelphax striatellus]|uniref:PID domain-containing protein n=1 Tax=Laodelphax striatellus TaxID=195883 RepID=A0A482WJB1_LAOST|nr:hypothetical protein LSTR_LSTR006997 [Laodelphax striatellus]
MCETSASVDKPKELLPQSFNVKYLGHRESKGLWGIKNTRRPVDAMILHAKQSTSSLVPMRIDVTRDGCTFTYNNKTKVHPIDTISYGVQDLVYTRVFSMIIVRDISDVRIEQHPFECHAFMCESKQAARQLTYCLAAAFQDYSKRVKATNNAQQKFAIDLRSPEEIQADLKVDSEA